MKSNISEQTNYLQNKFTIIHQQNYIMSPLSGVMLAGLAKKYPKNGGVRKANWTPSFRTLAKSRYVQILGLYISKTFFKVPFNTRKASKSF